MIFPVYLYYLILSHIILYYLILSYIILYYLIWSHIILYSSHIFPWYLSKNPHLILPSPEPRPSESPGQCARRSPTSLRRPWRYRPAESNWPPGPQKWIKNPYPLGKTMLWTGGWGGGDDKDGMFDHRKRRSYDQKLKNHVISLETTSKMVVLTWVKMF